MKNNNNVKNTEKKNTVKIIIASLILATVAAGSAIIITACVNSNAASLPTEATAVTQTITEKATEKASEKATTAPTEKATQKPTQKATQAPTQKPTQAPTQAPATKPTQAPAPKPTDKPAEPTEAPVKPTEAPAKPTEEPTEIETGSTTYEVLKNVITTSKANGYAVTKLDGIEGKVLVLSYGKDEAKSSCKIYRIGDSELSSLGKISTAHSAAYLDENECLCLYKAHMSNYSYGSVTVDENNKLGIDVVRQGIVKADESYPEIPGDKLSLLDINDLSGIGEYQ